MFRNYWDDQVATNPALEDPDRCVRMTVKEFRKWMQEAWHAGSKDTAAVAQELQKPDNDTTLARLFREAHS